jgi:GNAT superfamily N-acetyltransferase
MSGSAPITRLSRICDAVEIVPLEIDQMSDLRHLHALSARRLAAGILSDLEIEAFAAHIYSDTYSMRLSEVVRARRLLGARLDGALVATAGWTPANDAGAVARLLGVFVSPLYAREGIGRLLVEAVEAQALQAGFGVCTVRAPLGAADFFAALGYDIASHGVWPLDREAAIPVAFMRKATARPAAEQPGTVGGG